MRKIPHRFRSGESPGGRCRLHGFWGSQKHDVANQAGAEGDNRLAPTASQKTSEEETAEVKMDHVEKSIKGKLGKGDPHKVSQADLELGVPRGALPKTTRKAKKPSAWEEHEQLIAGLMEHLNEKMPDGKTRRTVTAETRKLVDEIQKSFTQIRKLMRAASKTIISVTTVSDKQTDGEVNQRAQLLCGVQNELFQSPGNTNWYSPL